MLGNPVSLHYCVRTIGRNGLHIGNVFYAQTMTTKGRNFLYFLYSILAYVNHVFALCPEWNVLPSH